MTIQLWVSGDPIPKGRARHGRTKSGLPITYSDPKTANYEAYIALCASQVYKGVPLDQPIKVFITAFLERPKRPDKKYKDFPAGRPDLDNYVKAVLDGVSLAGVWKDDARVVCLHADKKWAGPDGPGLSIRIETI